MMVHSNFSTNMINFDICNQLKHVPLKALVAQWVHPSKDVLYAGLEQSLFKTLHP